MAQPAWMTDELAEEWVEPAQSAPTLSYRAGPGRSVPRLPSWSASRSPSDENSPPPGEGMNGIATSTPPPLHPSAYGSIKWVGTGRKALADGGTARAGMGMRVVSGDVDGGQGSLLAASPTGGVSGLFSPPLSDRSASGSGSGEGEKGADAASQGGTPPAGTFVQRSTLVVHASRPDTGSQAQRGGGIGLGKPLRNPFAPATPGVGGQQAGAGGLFAPLKLESMFRVPTPPREETERAGGKLESGSPEREGRDDLERSTEEREEQQHQQEQQLPVRRASHSYVPRRPSRLSKSVTPSSPSSGGSGSRDVSAVMQGEEDEASGSERGWRDEDGQEGALGPGDDERADDEDDKLDDRTHTSRDSGVDATPTTTHRSHLPLRHFSGSRGRSASPSRPGADAEFTFTPSPPSRPPSNFTVPPGNPAESRPLKLFRDSWDTFTRDQLSAIVEGVSARGTPVKGGMGQSRLRSRWSGSGGRSASGSSGSGSARSVRSRASRTPSSGSGSARSRRSWVEHPSVSDEQQYGSPHGVQYAEDDARSDASDLSQRASKRIRLSASPDMVKQGSRGDRRSWGEKGEDVLRRIRERQWAGTITASEMSADGSASQGTPTITSRSEQSPSESPPALPPAPQLAVPPVDAKYYGSLRSIQSGSGSGGTRTSGSGTITEQYLSAGRDIMSRIKDRKVSESSGTGGEDKGVAAAVARRAREHTSPRRALRRLSEVDERSRRLRQEGESSLSDVGRVVADIPAEANRPHQRPQNAAPEDLNRYVSSASTVPTMLTAVSTSFVKHRGPAAGPARRFKDVITYESVQKQLPQQVGKMIFDSQQMRWVRAEPPSRLTEEEALSSGSERSDDPFAGLDSLNEEAQHAAASSRGSPAVEDSGENAERPTRADHGAHGDTLPIVDEQDERGATMMSHWSDDTEDQTNPASTTDIATTAATMGNLSLRTDQTDQAGPAPHEAVPVVHVVKPSLDQAFQFPPQAEERPPLVTTQSDPTPLPTSTPAKLPATTPVSVLKRRMQAIDPKTPLNTSSAMAGASTDRRSVSFSDGRKSGKILDVLVHNGNHRVRRSWHEVAKPDKQGFFSADGQQDRSRGQKARSGLMRELTAAMDESGISATPSKRNSQSGSRSLTQADSDESPSSDQFDAARDRFPRLSLLRRSGGNATFLTECSFAVAHDKLVELITEVQPFEPHWEDLTTIDLSGKRADSVARLKEFLPKLDVAILNDNLISYLSGIPSSVRHLQVAKNRLSSLTAVNHLSNLQYLDVSYNQIESVNALSCLRHLRELRLDHNKISDISDIMDMDCLIKLSCSHNAIRAVDFGSAKWSKLETVDLSSNQIKRVEGVTCLTSLNTLNLENNRLESLTVGKSMSHLRSLRISHNDLDRLDISSMPRLRTLYADNNKLQGIARGSAPSTSRLENLSIRNQRVDSLCLTYEDLREVKRLYISGNPLDESFLPERPLYSLVYLEAAACSLADWPEHFAERVPNLRCLNLNYNFFRDLQGLQGLVSLRKLMLVGARLGDMGTKTLLQDLRSLPGLKEIDMRMNPCNFNYYLPLLIPSGGVASALDPSSASTCSWLGLDVNFRRSLPDEWYTKRLIYRGLVMMACDAAVQVDGIAVTEAERNKARRLIENATDL